MSEPAALKTGMGGTGSPGVDAVEDLVNAGLANFDNTGRLRPQLAEAVPSIENGLWQLFPDGRMTTTWKIRPGAQWHDGAAFDANDVVFSADVWRDAELPVRGDPAHAYIDSIEAADGSTIVVRWKRPFVEADTMFTSLRHLPIPRHLLLQPYELDKAGFTQLPFWSTEFVGTGPYRLRDWQRGSHLILEASDSYSLGRPKVDRIEVRFISDAKTLMTNVLAGSVDLTLGRGLSLQQGLQVRDQWSNGHIELAFAGWTGLYPQFLNPSPQVVSDTRFRRALLHAIDRQEIVETLMDGVVPVAHSYLNPSEPDYRAVEASVVRYDFDLRRAAQIIEDIGYAKGVDGMFRDAGSVPLSVEIRTTEDLATTLSIAGYWQRVGVAAEPLEIPAARNRDREYRANYPGFELGGQPNDLWSLKHLHGSVARLPPDYSGRNRSRYQSPEFDALLDRFFVAIPPRERVQILGEILHHMSDQLNVLGIFYNTDVTMVGNTLRNVTAGHATATNAWNAEQWEVP
ncbi:MAG: hypothetical protein HW416_2644 [Chloroflexi bacterium]|nr:hypothetical protein [Chloroflexota bacterium]